MVIMMMTTFLFCRMETSSTHSDTISTNSAWTQTQRATQLKSFSKVEIETNQGEYDKDGFFLLEDQSFYDPLGFYFNYKGFDEVGGYYDHYGLYINAKEEDEEYYDDYDLYGQSEKEYYDDLDDYGQSEED